MLLVIIFSNIKILEYMLEFEFDFGKVTIGNNAAENWEIIDKFKKQKTEAIWFHLNKKPSCHVIFEPSKKLNKKHIKNISRLCKQYSKFKNVRRIGVCYTDLCNIKKDTEEGSVIIKKSEVIMV